MAALTKDLLINNGYAVVGPIGTVDIALAAAREAEINAALLDINLHGSASYSVAEVLASRNIPFAFLTGYSLAGIDPSYAQVPLLQKPLDLDAFQDFFGSIGGLSPAAELASVEKIG